MDKLDMEILKILRGYSRISYTDIAKRLNVSEGAVRYRVKSLVDKGIIKRFTIEVSREGLPAIIGVKTNLRVTTRELCSQIMKINGVERSFEVTGDLDIIVTVRATSNQVLNQIIDSIRDFPGVTSTYTYLVLGEFGE